MMAFFLSFIRPVGLKILGVVAAVLALFWLGKRDEKKGRMIEDLRAYKDAKEKIDETAVSRTRDVALERLRDNDQVR